MNTSGYMYTGLLVLGLFVVTAAGESQRGLRQKRQFPDIQDVLDQFPNNLPDLNQLPNIDEIQDHLGDQAPHPRDGRRPPRPSPSHHPGIGPQPHVPDPLNPKPRPPTRAPPKPTPKPPKPLDTTVIVAITVPTVGVVLIAVVVAVAVVLVKRKRRRSSISRQGGGDGEELGHVNGKDLSPKEDRALMKPSNANVYTAQESIGSGQYAMPDDVYHTVEATQIIRQTDSPPVKRVGPLPHRPTSIEQPAEEESTAGKTPLTPPRAGIDDYYSYADSKSVPCSTTASDTEKPENPEQTEEIKDPYYIDLEAKRQSSQCS